MDDARLFPALALTGGCAAFVLRLLQDRTGFDPATGLARPGDPWGILLTLLLAALAVSFLLLARRFPKEAPLPDSFPAAFHTGDSGLSLLLQAGCALLALSALAELLRAALYQTLRGGDSTLVSLLLGDVRLTDRASWVLGVLGLVSAWALYRTLRCCLRRARLVTAEPPHLLLLIPPVAMVIRLAFIYRVESVAPSLAAYYIELLALAFLTLALYRMSGFPFHAPRPQGYLLWAAMAVVCSMAALADAPTLPGGLLYAGGALLQLALLHIRCRVLSPASLPRRRK